MSGTSLDGLDMAYCEFEKQQEGWKFSIVKAETATYSDKLRRQIISAETMSGRELALFDVQLGAFFGQLARDFIDRNGLSPDFVCSHGQTIFHQPNKGYTLQIGNLAALCSKVRQTTIGDFRTMDVALGGQGAPLVPIGDLLLFKDYEDCLNIGGFSNISHKQNGNITSYDICPVNIVLNYLCQKIGLTFDDGGKIAQSNPIDEKLLSQLDALPYYKDLKSGNSLGKEWVEENIFPILENSSISVKEQIATYTLHAAKQISRNIKGRTLATGGGAYNDYLMKLIRQNTTFAIEIAERTITDFKEAMIFAFLGVLRVRNEANCLQSVTGASRSCCSGTILQWI